MRRRIIFNHNQLILPFREGGGTAITTYESRERAFWFLASACLFSLALYVYAINATAHHIAVRQHLERKVVELSTQLSSLEFAYIELTNAVTMDVARQYGFSEARKPLYVSRDAAVNSLTFNTAR